MVILADKDLGNNDYQKLLVKRKNKNGGLCGCL